MKNIVFIAPPAAGKGTQSKLISSNYNMPHISLGDIMREARDPETEVGRIIIKCQDERSLVPLDITLKLLKERLIKDDCKNGYILDGFPRSIEQAVEYDKILDELGYDIGNVIYMDIDKDLALKRTLSRVVCSDCGTSYNLLVDDLKPNVDGVCDKCGASLKTRSDDNAETFVKGFDTYIEKTQPLIKFYKDKGVLKEIKVSEDESTEDIYNKIIEFIK